MHKTSTTSEPLIEAGNATGLSVAPDARDLDLAAPSFHHQQTH